MCVHQNAFLDDVKSQTELTTNWMNKFGQTHYSRLVGTIFGQTTYVFRIFIWSSYEV